IVIASEVEVGEKKDRVTNTLNATKVADYRGIVPGDVLVMMNLRDDESLFNAGFTREVDRADQRSLALRALPCQAL
ncbi:chaperonin CPN60-2, mitochondrial, partial [Tanacetum coccineum]